MKRLFRVQMDELLRKYLKRRNFKMGSEMSQYKKRLLLDFIAALVYGTVSVVLICIQEAALVVLGLNILCIFRALMSTTISASEVTKKMEGAEVDKTCSSHYREKAILLGAFFFFAVVILVLLLFDFSIVFTKVFASLAIGVTFLNDTDNIICAYNAKL